MLRTHVSVGNSKMGKVASVSLTPIKYCYHCKGVCDKECYALKSYKQYKNVRNAWDENAAIAISDPAQIGADVVEWLRRHKSFKLFRWHVSGDIPSLEYFAMMITTAASCPDVTFWAFTKNYEIVNKYLDMGGKIPSNLTIIFSNWGDFKCENPHNLPCCEVIDGIDDFVPGPNNFLCGGDCENCMICRSLLNGQKVCIVKH